MSTGCCSWIFCRRSTEVELDNENGNGTTKVVRKTTKNGGTTTTTTTTTYFNSTSARGEIGMGTTSFMPPEPEEVNLIIGQSNAKIIPTTGRQFEEECLNEHNRLRALHGCPPLKLNHSMSAKAKKWAISMANRNTMVHSKSNYGENLYMCSGYSIDGRKAVESWYDEIKDYDFRNPVFDMRTGHFTQVVWKDSKELGVGVEIRGNSTWVVANYDPPGNVQGNFSQNVPRPLRS